MKYVEVCPLCKNTDAAMQKPMNPPSYANSIPLLDLSRFDAAESKERAEFLAGLKDAAREVGFFYLAGHGNAPELAAQAHGPGY